MTLSAIAAADEAPAREALVAGDLRLSFAELGREVATAAARFRDLEPGPVPIVCESRAGTVAELFALFELGAPALLLHPRLPEAARSELAARRALATEDVLAVAFTSGSTGRPKGVELSQRAFVASARASAAVLGWREEDRWLCCLPLAHVGGLSILTRCLLARRTAVLAPRFDPELVARLLVRERITLLSLVPTMLARLLDLEPNWEPPASLRAVLVGGAWAAPALLDRAGRRGVPIVDAYGMTETCSHVALDGAPLPGVELAVREGRLQVRGPMLMNGYAPPDDQPLALDPDGWLDTGDRAALEGGRLRVLGRADATIVTGGENVDPIEVERVLTELDGVRAACVFGVEDPAWGEVVAAAVVAPEGNPRALLRSAAERLAPHQRPRRLAIVEELPLGPNGKVNRAEARARAAESWIALP